jgi:hypothetical protein
MFILDQLIRVNRKKRGLLTIIVGSTALVILVFLSLFISGNHGMVISFDWYIQFFCTDEWPSQYGCQDWLVFFSAKWLLVVSILTVAVGVVDYLGIFSSDGT